MKILFQYVIAVIFLSIITIVPFIVDKIFLGNLTGYAHLFYYITMSGLMWIIIESLFLSHIKGEE